MDRTPVVEPLLIWGSGALIAVLLGVGSAFFLWARVQDVPGTLVVFSVGALALGLALCAVASGRRFTGTLIVLYAASLVLSLIAAAPTLAHLA